MEVSNSVVVVGSTNIDLVMQVETLPARGETVGNARFSQALGGKGANQAVAAARTGARTVFVSVVGDDDFGRQAKAAFAADEIDVSCVSFVEAPTGTALIFVDRQGENCIGVAPGANASCTAEAVGRAASRLETAAVVLMQLEIPYATVVEVLKQSKRARCVVNAAPALTLPPADLRLIDVLVVNETELYQVLGETPLCNAETSELDTACRRLHAQGVNDVIVTLGKAGIYVSDGTINERFSGFDVNVTDTTGAGDTFCGALAARLAAGDTLTDASHFAQASAALSCTSLGAQTAIPTYAAVKEFMRDAE